MDGKSYVDDFLKKFIDNFQDLQGTQDPVVFESKLPEIGSIKCGMEAFLQNVVYVDFGQRIVETSPIQNEKDLLMIIPNLDLSKPTYIDFTSNKFGNFEKDGI